ERIILDILNQRRCIRTVIQIAGVGSQNAVSTRRKLRHGASRRSSCHVERYRTALGDRVAVGREAYTSTERNLCRERNRNLAGGFECDRRCKCDRVIHLGWERLG